MESAKNVVAMFRRLADSGVGVLMVTHDSASLPLSDRIYDMAEGVLTLRGDAGTDQ